MNKLQSIPKKKGVTMIILLVFMIGCNMNPSKEDRIKKIESEMNQLKEKIEQLEGKIDKLEMEKKTER